MTALELLDEHSAQAQALLATLRADLADMVAATAGANTDDEHDPEGSTIAFERSQLVLMIEAARRRLVEVQAARTRVLTGNYGRCQRCRAEIGAARLAARPSAELCINCAASAHEWPISHRIGG